jgi:hypothetical protein
MRRYFVLMWCLATLPVTGCARSEPRRTNSGKVLAIGDLTWQEIDALAGEEECSRLAYSAACARDNDDFFLRFLSYRSPLQT